MSSLEVEDAVTAGVSTQRPVTAVVGGAFIAVCAGTAVLSAAVPDLLVTSGGVQYGWDYPPQTWALLLALAVAGLVVMTHPRWARPAAVVAAIVAAQVAGNGLIMIRDWFNANGTGGDQRYLLATMVTWAAVVPLAATAAAMATVAMVWREPVGRWRSVLPARPGYLVLGVAVVLLLPLAWDTVQEDRDIIPAGHTVLMYSLPWGAGLAAVGWLRGRAAVTAGLTVTVSAVVCLVLVVSTHMLVFYSTPPPPVGD